VKATGSAAPNHFRSTPRAAQFAQDRLDRASGSHPGSRNWIDDPDDPLARVPFDDPQPGTLRSPVSTAR
jgi:hypothetical protein